MTLFRRFVALGRLGEISSYSEFIERSDKMLASYLADRIRDAAAWYGRWDRSGEPAVMLRSGELKPKLTFFEVFKMCQSVESAAKYQAALVGDVCLRRNVILREGLAEPPVTGERQSGRILILDTFASTFDGLAADSTGGFIDDSDCPPWDLWIDYEISTRSSSPHNLRGLLSAWIPSRFFDTVNEAITVCGGEALSWGSEEHAGLDAVALGAFVSDLERSVYAA